MIETSAHLVDHVIPDIPTRQWVLSFPWLLRLLFNSRPGLLGWVLAVVARGIETDLIHRAGLTREAQARGGLITRIQRFGSALYLNWLPWESSSNICPGLNDDSAEALSANEACRYPNHPGVYQPGQWLPPIVLGHSARQVTQPLVFLSIVRLYSGVSENLAIEYIISC